ncbi:P-II family nitrogen regulator [Geothermobacter ehrlichii]|uniref:P-II family nitrogen regulator n=1 Tax=Geothermobacter ehrlichii TaxID=213224 RepID=UPI0038B2C264
MEILCCDALVEEVVSLIEKAAHTGLKGDGKIYVSTIDMAVRISTGERGGGAV